VGSAWPRIAEKGHTGPVKIGGIDHEMNDRVVMPSLMEKAAGTLPVVVIVALADRRLGIFRVLILIRGTKAASSTATAIGARGASPEGGL